MLYFARLFGKKVFNQNRQYLGSVYDFYFLAEETPLITKLVVKTPDKKKFVVPIQEARKNGIGFILKSNYTRSEKTDEDISLLFTLQNQQIIDIKGEKIIRVNDVILGDVPEYTILGIDIGILGVFRWIGAANLMADFLRTLGVHYKSEFIPWSDLQPSEIAKGRIVLKKEQEKLKKIRPEDLAEHLEHATIQNVIKALRVMGKDVSARVLADLHLDYQKEILGRYSPMHAGKILSLIDATEIVDVLLAIDREKRERIMQYIEKEKLKQVKYLMSLAKTTIGHLMSTNYLSVPAETLVKTVINKITKDTENFSELLYVYIVNEQKQVVGVLNLHELLLQKPNTPLYHVMNQNLILGRLTTPKEIVLRRLMKYHIYAMPIVDEGRRLLGIVSLEDIAEDMIQKENYQ